MATISKNWAAAVELHKTAAYGGSDAILLADQQYDFLADVDLETSGYLGAQVLVEANRTFTRSPNGPAGNDLIVDVFASLDGSIFDTVPFASHRLKMKSDIEKFSFLVLDLTHFRLGVKTSDTDGTFDYRITHQLWNLDNT